MNDQQRGYRHEFLDADPETGVNAGQREAWADLAHPSGRGAGPLGFAGTVQKDAAKAAGLATLAGDEFGGGPALPMLPCTWEPDEHGLGEGDRSSSPRQDR
jgi:hypothetical protein